MTAIVTLIYSEFWGTKEFKRSLKNLGLTFHNAWTSGHGGGNGLYDIWQAYRSLRNTHDKAIYSDGADTYFVNSFEPPDNKIVYSAEKACYPHPWMENEYLDKQTPWCYLNGGNCCGPIELLLEFFERYDINTYKDQDVNGQLIMSKAYLKAKKDGFPIELDQQCEYFQTLAFSATPGESNSVYEHDFAIVRYEDKITKPYISNTKTGTIPHILHGNGRTDMTWIYNLYNKWHKEHTKSPKNSRRR